MLVRHALILLAYLLAVAPSAHAVLGMGRVDIETSAQLDAVPGARNVRSGSDSARSSSEEFFFGIGSAVGHESPPFSRLQAHSLQQISGINGVRIDAPFMGLFNEIDRLHARSNWRTILSNSIFPVPVTLHPVMEFFIVGGELEFNCYNCFLKPTTVTLVAEITANDDSPIQPPPRWRYSARLTSNGFLPPTFDTSDSLDPHGVGLPATIITQGQNSIRVEIQPFIGVLPLPRLFAGSFQYVTYSMFAEASGDIGLEGAIKASLGDPFDVSEGARPRVLIDGQTVNALLTPVPEASTWVTMLCGIGVLALVCGTRRRRDRRG